MISHSELLAPRRRKIPEQMMVTGGVFAPRTDNFQRDTIFAALWMMPQHRFTILTRHPYNAALYLDSINHGRFVDEGILRRRKRLEPGYKGPLPPWPLPNVEVLDMQRRPVEGQDHEVVQRFQRTGKWYE